MTCYKNGLKNIVYIRTIMPNECYNRVTITSTNENDITYILQEINVEIPDVIITQISKLGVRLEFITAWKPDIQFIDTLINKYPLSWIKNEWISEDGKCGIWVGNKNNIKFMDWEDLSNEDEHHFFHN